MLKPAIRGFARGYGFGSGDLVGADLMVFRLMMLMASCAWGSDSIGVVCGALEVVKAPASVLDGNAGVRGRRQRNHVLRLIRERKRGSRSRPASGLGQGLASSRRPARRSLA